MSQLLISEPPLQVLPSLAVEIGLNEALVLQQVHYWLLRSTHEHEGCKWAYNTIEQWHEQFPFWSLKTIQRTLSSLRDSGHLIAKKLSNTGCDHTLYYTVNYDLMSKSNRSNCPNGLGQIVQNTITTEITTENTNKGIDETSSSTAKKITFDKFVEQRKAEDLTAIIEEDPVWKVIDSLGMPDDFALLQWRYLEEQYSLAKGGTAKRYNQWPLVLAKALRGLWGQLFFKHETQGWILTSKGKNLKELSA